MTVAVGAAAFVDDLAVAVKSEVVVIDGIATFDYTIPLGSKIGEKIRVGLAIPGDWPASPPPGPHVHPALTHPGGAVHASPLGRDWCYWSRPFNAWATSAKTIDAYMAHIRTLFSLL